MSVWQQRMNALYFNCIKEKWKGVTEACLNPILYKEMSVRDRTRNMGRVRSPQGGGASGQHITSFYSSHCSRSVFLSLFLQLKPTSQPLTRPRLRARLVLGQQHGQRSLYLSWEDTRKEDGSGWKACVAEHVRSGGSGSLAVQLWESSSQAVIDKDDEGTHMVLVCESRMGKTNPGAVRQRGKHVIP